MGLDGAAQISKSLNNYIGVLDDYDQIITRLKPAFTDPKRIRRDDAGNPDICNIFSFHKLFSDDSTCEEVSAECPKGSIGCFDCKQKLARAMDTELAPIRERANTLRSSPKLVLDALDAGRTKAGNIAKETMREVRVSMGIGLSALNKL